MDGLASKWHRMPVVQILMEKYTSLHDIPELALPLLDSRERNNALPEGERMILQGTHIQYKEAKMQLEADLVQQIKAL